MMPQLILKQIKKFCFLVKNSAETSTMEASWNFLNSINNKDIIAISKTDFGKKDIKRYQKSL